MWYRRMKGRALEPTRTFNMRVTLKFAWTFNYYKIVWYSNALYKRTPKPGRSRRASVATESASRYNRPPSMLEWRRGAQPASSTLSFPRRRDTVNHGGSNRKQVLLADEWVVDEPTNLEKLSHEPGDKALDRKAPSPPVAHSDCDKKMPSPIQHKSPPKAVSQVNNWIKQMQTQNDHKLVKSFLQSPGVYILHFDINPPTHPWDYFFSQRKFVLIPQKDAILNPFTSYLLQVYFFLLAFTFRFFPRQDYFA